MTERRNPRAAGMVKKKCHTFLLYLLQDRSGPMIEGTGKVPKAGSSVKRVLQKERNIDEFRIAKEY
jgi:hypothetical protein